MRLFRFTGVSCGSPSYEGKRRVNGKTSYTITKGEQAKMRSMRLDPSNKLHAKAWAKSRMESIREMER